MASNMIVYFIYFSGCVSRVVTGIVHEYNCDLMVAHVDVLETTLLKSRIRETKHLLTDADSSTDTTVGWTKNILKKGKNHPKRKNSTTSRDMTILTIYPLTRGLKSIGKRGFHHVL